MAADIEARPFVNRVYVGDSRIFFSCSVPKALAPHVTPSALEADRIATEKALADLVAIALGLRARLRT